MRNNSTIYGGKNQGVKWKNCAMWGGGFVTGQDKVGSTHVIRTDTAGSWIWNTTTEQWDRLVRMGDNVAEGQGAYNYYGGKNGCYDVAIAPSDENTIYVCEMGYVYKTTDKGVTMTRTNLAQMTELSPNDDARARRRRLVVDSGSASVVGLFDCMTTSGGFRYSLDSGANWTKSASVPAGTTGMGGCVAFDRDSATNATPTRHKNWGVFSPGNGLYLSTNGPDGAFALDTGYPGNAEELLSLVMFGNGVILACSYGGGAYKLYRRTAAGVWSTRVASDAPATLALNFADTTKVLGSKAGGALLASTDSGQTWTTDPNSAPPRVASDAPWLATTHESYMTEGMILFDPAVAGRVWFSEGIGIWYTDSVSYTQGVIPTWTSQNKGLRNLVTLSLNVTPTGVLLWSGQDRNTARIADLDVCPSQVGVTNAVNLLDSNDRDYAKDDEDFQVVTLYGTNPGPLLKATDGGLGVSSWSAPAGTRPDGASALGGNVAVSTASNFVVLPSDNFPPYYTTDGGTTFAYCLFAGSVLPTVNGNGGTAHGLKPFNGNTLKRKVLVADPNNANCFWLYVCDTDDGAGATFNTNYHGVWYSTDGGANFTRKYTSNLDGSGMDFWHSHLIAVPGKAGHLFWTCGDVSLDDHAANVLVKFSSDYGATWTALPGLYECESICVGGAAPGASYPTLMGYGYTAVADSSTRRFMRSTDFNPASPASLTWTQFGPDSYPMGDYCSGITLGAHPNDAFGLVRVGKAGAGVVYGVYDQTVDCS